MKRETNFCTFCLVFKNAYTNPLIFLKMSGYLMMVIRRRGATRMAGVKCPHCGDMSPSHSCLLPMPSINHKIITETGQIRWVPDPVVVRPGGAGWLGSPRASVFLGPEGEKIIIIIHYPPLIYFTFHIFHISMKPLPSPDYYNPKLCHFLPALYLPTFLPNLGSLSVIISPLYLFLFICWGKSEKSNWGNPSPLYGCLIFHFCKCQDKEFDIS